MKQDYEQYWRDECRSIMRKVYGKYFDSLVHSDMFWTAIAEYFTVR